MIKMNEIMKNAYEKWAEKEYIFEKKNGAYQAITMGDFLRKVNSIAHELIKRGLQDKRIIVFGPNSTHYMMTDLAVFSYVGTSVNVNCQTEKEELVKIVKALQIDAIIYDERLKAVFDQMKEEVGEIQYLGMQSFIESLSTDDETFDLEGRDENLCAKIIYSSGTTSTPKGIMLSIKNIFSGWESLQRRTPFTEKDVVYLFLPLHHTYANIYNFIYSLLSGLSIYLCSGIDKIEEELLEVNPTIFCGVPLIYKRIYENHKENLNTVFGTRIKYMYCGGTRFDPEIRKAYKLCGLPMFEAYALTETASSFSIEYPNKDDYESAGTIFEDIDVKIIHQDEEGVGEIIVKGDNVFLGYANNEELTKSVFTEDGYFITGDYGYIKDNKLYLVGRRTDIIIGDNGENVYVKEIEKALKEYCQDVLKIQASLVDGKIHYKIFIHKDSQANIDAIIEEYNSKATKKDCVKFYEKEYTEQMNLKG